MPSRSSRPPRALIAGAALAALALVALFALVALVALVAPLTPAAAAPPPAPTGRLVAVTGELRVVHADPEPGRPAVPDQLWLHTGSRTLQLHHVDPAASGTRVTVTGMLHADTLDATRTEVLTPARAAAVGGPRYSPRTIRTAYLLTRFASDPEVPYPTAGTRTTVFGPTNSVAAYYREATDGAITVTGDVLGWYTVDTTPTCDWEAWATQGRAAATAAGIDMSQYDEVVVAGPHRSFCPFAGVAYVAMSGAYINGNPSVYVVAHEVGHNFGVSHASSLRCASAGTPVTVGGSCTRYEYGDPYSVMGTSTRLHTAQQEYQILQHLTGGVPAEKISTATTGRYTLARRHTCCGPELLRIPRPSTTTSFDLELRATTGSFDTFPAQSNPVSGVTIRISPTRLDEISQSQLLDATPATESFEDGAFTPGTSLVDPTSGLVVRVDAVSASGATITVSQSGGGVDTTPPSLPGPATGTASPTGVTLRWSAAVDAGSTPAYEIAQDGLLVGRTTGLSFTVTKVFPNSTHTYAVWARDRAGNPGPARTVSVHTPADAVPPSGVGALRATSTTPTSIALRWDAATDNVLLYGYELLVDGQPRWVDPTACCTASIQGLAPASTHTFQITAIDGSGNRGRAAVLTARTKPPAAG